MLPIEVYLFMHESMALHFVSERLYCYAIINLRRAVRLLIEAINFNHVYDFSKEAAAAQTVRGSSKQFNVGQGTIYMLYTIYTVC